MKNYAVLCGEKTKPIQSQTNPILFSPQIYLGVEKPYLKKQSQFARGIFNAIQAITIV